METKKKYYLTVDGGTTNTRVYLTDGVKVFDSEKIAAGSSGKESAPILRAELAKAIPAILARNGLTEADVERVLASGMITSEFGLCPLEHLPAPAGVKEMHAAQKEISLPEICGIPFVFFRGVKTCPADPIRTDMMRGEETELMGISYPARTLIVLPGSHSKLIMTDSEGRISDFSTMLTGEMLAALSEHTILRDAVELGGKCREIESELAAGYDYASVYGLNEALFKVRVLKNKLGKNADERYSFFLGAILQAEIAQIVRMDPDSVLIGGKRAFREPEAFLLRRVFSKPVRTLSDDDSALAPLRGAVRIYEE